MEEKQESISEKLDRITKQNEELISSKKEKGWKLPFGKKPSKAQVKKGWTTVQIIRNNGNIDFTKAKIEDNTINIDGLPRVAIPDYILTYKNTPFIIIPEWSLKPFSPVENYADLEKQKNTTIGWRLIQAKMEKEAIKPAGKGFGSMGWIILVVVGLAVGYYFLKGGKIF